jgi:U3 small nucleolar RNA-associated protein 12
MRMKPRSHVLLTYQVLIGTKSGELELFDIAASTMISSTKAHDGPIWSIDLRADGGGVVSGSADKDVKFWDIALKDVEGPGSKIVTRLGEERTVSCTWNCDGESFN